MSSRRTRIGLLASGLAAVGITLSLSIHEPTNFGGISLGDSTESFASAGEAIGALALGNAYAGSITETEALNILAGTSGLTKTDAANYLVANGVRLAIPLGRVNTAPARMNGTWASIPVAAGLGIASQRRTSILCVGHTYRLAFGGEIVQVKMRVEDKANLNGYYVTIWRRTAGGRFYLVCRSVNLLSRLTATSLNTLTMTSADWVYTKDVALGGGSNPDNNLPKMGDYVGSDVTAASTGFSNLVWSITNDANCETRYVFNAVDETPPSARSFTWYAQSVLSSSDVRIECYAACPAVAVDGYSQAEGRNIAIYYTDDVTQAQDTTSATDPALTTTQWDKVLFTSLRPGVRWFNAGITAQSSAQIIASASVDVFSRKPQWVIVQMGGNDTDSLAVYNNMKTYLDSCQVRTIFPIVIGLAPMTSKTNAEMFRYDRMNVALRNLCATHATKPLFIDLAAALGQNTASGTPTPPTGNLWDIVTAYNADGLHYNATGQAAMALAIHQLLVFDPSRP